MGIPVGTVSRRPITRRLFAKTYTASVRTEFVCVIISEITSSKTENAKEMVRYRPESCLKSLLTVTGCRNGRL